MLSQKYAFRLQLTHKWAVFIDLTEVELESITGEHGRYVSLIPWYRLFPSRSYHNDGALCQKRVMIFDSASCSYCDHFVSNALSNVIALCARYATFSLRPDSI
jgi:hypothetical protein